MWPTIPFLLAMPCRPRAAHRLKGADFSQWTALCVGVRGYENRLKNNLSPLLKFLLEPSLKQMPMPEIAQEIVNGAARDKSAGVFSAIDCHAQKHPCAVKKGLSVHNFVPFG